MAPVELLLDLARHIPGALGSASSMLFMRNVAWIERLTFAVAGTAMAHYIAPMVLLYTSMPETAALYLTGLFGILAVRKLLASLDALDVTPLIKGWFARILGVPPDA